MSLELMHAIALVYGLNRHDIDKQLNPIYERESFRLKLVPASDDSNLKLLDALARLCAPAKPKTVLATSMAITEDRCRIWLAVNGSEDVPPAICNAVETLWRRLAEYSTDPRRRSDSAGDREAAEEPVYAAAMNACVLKMRHRIHSRFETFCKFVQDMEHTVDAAVRDHTHYVAVLAYLKKARQHLSYFCKAAEGKSSGSLDDADARFLVNTSRLAASNLSPKHVSVAGHEPLQLFGSEFQSNKREEHDIAAFDVVRYIAKVVSVHQDVHLLLAFARKARGRIVLSKKVQVISIPANTNVTAEAGLSTDAVASVSLGEDLTDESVKEMVHKACESTLATDTKGTRLRPANEDQFEQANNEATGQGNDAFHAAMQNAADRIRGNLERREHPMTQAHAECILLHHHLQNPNVATTGAVGCNKPACYYCSLYFRKAAPFIQITGSHDHIYAWHPPAPVSTDVEKAMIEELLAVVGTVAAELVQEEETRRISESTSGGGSEHGSPSAAVRAAVEEMVERRGYSEDDPEDL